MRGSPGEKINQGGTADIDAWAPGQVVKLFKEGFPPQLGQQEARMTQAVFAAGVPAPEVFGEVTLDGRFGIVLGRLDGPTLLQVTRSGAVIVRSRLARSLRPSARIRSQDVTAAGGHVSARLDGCRLQALGRPACPRASPSSALALIDRLQQPGERAVPCWRHPPRKRDHEGGRLPRLIDWTFFDPARLRRSIMGSLTSALTEFALDVTDTPQRPLAVNAAAQSEYARLSGKPVRSPEASPIETWLPIAIVRYFLAYGRVTDKASDGGGMMQRARSGPAPAKLDPPSPVRGRQCLAAQCRLRVIFDGFDADLSGWLMSSAPPISAAAGPGQKRCVWPEPL